MIEYDGHVQFGRYGDNGYYDTPWSNGTVLLSFLRV